MLKRQSLARRVSYHVAGFSIVLGILSACSLDEPIELKSTWTVDDARQFDEYQLYWLGQSYNGLPLTVLLGPAPEPRSSIMFVYGEVSYGASGWRAPLFVGIQPYCSDPRERLRLRLEPYVERGGQIEDVQIRGANGWLLGGRGGSLYLWPGDVTVTMGSREDIPLEELGRDLIAMTEDTGATPQALPATARLSC